MKRALAITFGLLALGHAVRAEEKDPTETLLDSVAKLSSVEERAARIGGRATFGIHLGRKNVGSLDLEVAPTTSGTATWHARAHARLSLEDEQAELRDEGLLDRRLAPERIEERENEGNARKGALPLARTLLRGAEGFELVLPPPSPGEKPRTQKLVPTRPLVHGIAARHALLRALDPKTKTLLRTNELDPETNQLREVEIEVAGTPTATADPESAKPLWPVVVRAGRDEWTYLLDPDAPPARRVTRFARAKEAVEYVLAKDAESATRDLPPPKRPPPGTGRATILAYLEAVEARDADKLEKLLDWAALHRKYGEGGQSVDQFKKFFLDQFKAAGHDDHGPEESPLDLVPRLQEEPFAPDALETSVRIRGEGSGAFKLVRDKPESPWRIAEIPD